MENTEVGIDEDLRSTSEKSPRYKGVGGWLALFVFYLLCVRLLGLAALNAELGWKSPEIYNFGMAVGLIDYAIGAAVAISLLTLKSKGSVWIAKIYLIVLVVCNLAFLFLAIYNLSSSGPSIVSGVLVFSDSAFLLGRTLGQLLMGQYLILQPNIAQTAILVFLCLIWYLYFTFSKRIKAIYFHV